MHRWRCILYYRQIEKRVEKINKHSQVVRIVLLHRFNFENVVKEKKHNKTATIFGSRRVTYIFGRNLVLKRDYKVM